MWLNRQEAGQRLAAAVCADSRVAEADHSAMMVLSIPRGGVVVGDVVAQTLQCTHDVMIAKKIGFPEYEELAIGAIAEDGGTMLDLAFIDQWHLKKQRLSSRLSPRARRSGRISPCFAMMRSLIRTADS